MLPAIVDHDERRKVIAAAAGRLIAERGSEALTLREVAKAAGYSTAIIGHYFTGKLDMLIFTSRQARLRALAGIEALLVDAPSPLGCLTEFLPLDDERRTDFMMWFGFWGKSMAEPEIAAERLDAHQGARRLMKQILAKAQAQGEVPPHVDIVNMAATIQALINGIASLVVHEPEQWPATRQRQIFETQVALMCGAPGRSPVSTEQTITTTMMRTP